MPDYRLVTRLLDGRSLHLRGSENSLLVLHNVLEALIAQRSEQIFTYRAEGRATAIPVREIEWLGKVEREGGGGRGAPQEP